MDKEILKKLKDAKGSGEEEYFHCEADRLLCKLLLHLGYKEIVDAYKDLDKWYE